MRKILLCTFSLILVYVFSSCIDEEVFANKTRNVTTFSVYECDENYTEKSIATSYVSIGAEVSIWGLVIEDEIASFILVDIISTGIDGKAVYRHNKESFYYSVEKITEDNETLSNLLSPLSTTASLTNSFEIAGVFSSEKDIENYHKYNLPHLSEKYMPKIGSVKFKDINGDNAIDVEDSVSKVYFYNPNREETVYLALGATK